ncbi:Flp family type IVb pilin [Candidatus Entotheonella serta]|nr:Flp family type IVb pilin [Candidatus Entotheonella serta]
MIHTYLVKDVRGATMIEYALLASLISVVVIGALSPIGQRLFAIFDFIRVSLGG